MYMARGATLTWTHSPLHVHLLALTIVHDAHDIHHDYRSSAARDSTTCRAQAMFQTRSAAASRMASAWSRSGFAVNGEHAVLLCLAVRGSEGYHPKEAGVSAGAAGWAERFVGIPSHLPPRSGVSEVDASREEASRAAIPGDAYDACVGFARAAFAIRRQAVRGHRVPRSCV